MYQSTDSVRVQLPGGGSIWAEVSAVGPAEQEVAFESLSEALSLEAVREAIGGIAELTLDTIKALAPTKASVEFGLELALESGKLTALWVKGASKANVKITLEWEKVKADG